MCGLITCKTQLRQAEYACRRTREMVTLSVAILTAMSRSFSSEQASVLTQQSEWHQVIPESKHCAQGAVVRSCVRCAAVLTSAGHVACGSAVLQRWPIASRCWPDVELIQDAMQAANWSRSKLFPSHLILLGCGMAVLLPPGPCLLCCSVKPSQLVMQRRISFGARTMMLLITRHAWSCGMQTALSYQPWCCCSLGCNASVDIVSVAMRGRPLAYAPMPDKLCA